MFNKFILVVGALFFLASCETATQDAIKSTAGKASSTAKAAKAGSASIFGSAKQTPADKLIAVVIEFYLIMIHLNYHLKQSLH